jgi:hypothetical protein
MKSWACDQAGRLGRFNFLTLRVLSLRKTRTALTLCVAPIELHQNNLGNSAWTKRVTERTIPMTRPLLRVLRVPPGTGATHIMLLGSIRIAYRASQLAPDARPSSQCRAYAHVLPHAAYRSQVQNSHRTTQIDGPRRLNSKPLGLNGASQGRYVILIDGALVVRIGQFLTFCASLNSRPYSKASLHGAAADATRWCERRGTMGRR